MTLFKKDTIGEAVAKESKKIEPELIDTLTGKRPVLAFLSFLIGGVFVANSLWVIASSTFGHWFTLSLGLVLFLFSGVLLHAFRDR